MTRARPTTAPAPTGRARRRALRLVLGVLAGCLALTGCNFNVYQLPLPGGANLGSDPITVQAQFQDVLDLVPKSAVKVDDVTVGEITDIQLDGYTALVTMKVNRSAQLPSNPVASIGQTSLLGEKFISLAPPPGGGTGTLQDGYVIPLADTGRNPEVEEVLGALSLVLNGGGVAQLKTIASEVNQTLDGREGAARSVLTQLKTLTGQLNDHRGDIVNAIDGLNRLARTARSQQGTIDQALEQLPSALDSLNAQRGDLVKMLQALDHLSGVGVRVIKRSKQSTFETLRQLNPVLTQLANSGSAFVNSISASLTYPFVDEVVGRDPQVARNLQMGDYTNLSAELDLDLTNLPALPGIPCTTLAQIPGNLPLNQILHLQNLCQAASDAITACVNHPSVATCGGLPAGVLTAVCAALPVSLPGVCSKSPTGNQPGGTTGLPGLPGIPGLPGLPGLGGLGNLLPGLGRVAPALSPPSRTAAERGSPRGHGPTMGQLSQAYDPTLVKLLTPGMVLR